MVFSPVFISHHPCFCRASLPLPKLSAPCFSPLDFPSLSLTLNLQPEVRRLSRPEIPTRSGLSTFNRVSFLSPTSPHLCALCGENSSSFRSSLIPRQSPLTAKSFTIRTSETPLPQLLYNPHLQASLGSAGNKGLITPLESALTENYPVTPVESALTKRGGWGYGAFRSVFWTPVKSRGLPSPEMQLRDVLRRSPFLATHPRTPRGVPCRSAAFLFFLATRHSPLTTISLFFSHVLARPLCRACDGHTARVR